MTADERDATALDPPAGVAAVVHAAIERTASASTAGR